MNKNRWLLPALASLAFLVFSLVVISREGPFGFVVEHTRNGWSVQIGFDLVLSAFTALGFIAPVARRVGVRMGPWIILTLLTGSIGLLALAARVLYLQSKSSEAAQAPASASPSVA